MCSLHVYSCCKMYRQDVTYFSNALVKMCCLWAGGLLAMHLWCVVFQQGAMYLCSVLFLFFFFFFSAHNVLSRYFVFQQCTCQDVSSFGRGTCMLTWTKIQLSNFSLASVVPKDFTLYIFIYIYIDIYSIILSIYIYIYIYSYLWDLFWIITVPVCMYVRFFLC